MVSFQAASGVSDDIIVLSESDDDEHSDRLVPKQFLSAFPKSLKHNLDGMAVAFGDMASASGLDLFASFLEQTGVFLKPMTM